MNKLLPNGNILAVYGAGDDDIMTSLVKEVPPGDPEYESCTFFMSQEDEKKALAILAEYRRKQPAGSWQSPTPG